MTTVQGQKVKVTSSRNIVNAISGCRWSYLLQSFRNHVLGEMWSTLFRRV